MNEARIHWHPLTSTDIHCLESSIHWHPLKMTANQFSGSTSRDPLTIPEWLTMNAGFIMIRFSQLQYLKQSNPCFFSQVYQAPADFSLVYQAQPAFVHMFTKNLLTFSQVYQAHDASFHRFTMHMICCWWLFARQLMGLPQVYQATAGPFPGWPSTWLLLHKFTKHLMALPELYQAPACFSQVY